MEKEDMENTYFHILKILEKIITLSIPKIRENLFSPKSLILGII